jgi:MFS family permease
MQFHSRNIISQAQLSCKEKGQLPVPLHCIHLLSARCRRGCEPHADLALYEGVAIAAGFATVAIGPLAIVASVMIVLGFGIHMLHNTLQTNATRMAPEARGLAVSTFANVLFMGQAAGVWLSGLVIDRIGYSPVFLAAARRFWWCAAPSRCCSTAAPRPAERGRNQRTPPRNLSIFEPFRLRFARHWVLAGEVDCEIRQPGERDDGS